MTAAEDAPVLAFDGTESDCGRALLTISALTFARDWIAPFRVVFLGVVHPDVRIALQVLAYDTGIAAETPEGGGLPPGALLYGAIASGAADHVRLAEAAAAGVSVVLAIQFPQPRWATPSVLAHADAAFDPRRFARHVGAVATSLLRQRGAA